MRAALKAGIELVHQLVMREDEWPLPALLAEFDADRLQLWAIQQDGKITTFAVTRIDQRPNAKVCSIPYAIASDPRTAAKWPELLAPIEDWARERGCTKLKANIGIKTPDAARKWARRLSEYRLSHVMFERTL